MKNECKKSDYDEYCSELKKLIEYFDRLAIKNLNHHVLVKNLDGHVYLKKVC